MRLIDADVLKEAFEEDGHLTGYIEEFIDDTPTIEAVKQEWISVEDRLPEQYSGVIAYDGDAVGEAFYDGEDFMWTENEDFVFATHWMPLPEPPKGE